MSVDFTDLAGVNAAIFEGFSSTSGDTSNAAATVAMSSALNRLRTDVDVAIPLASPAADAVPSLFPLQPTFPSSRLVRCVGMVQDVQDTAAMYQARVQQFVNPKTTVPYPDGEESGNDVVIVNVQQVYVVPVPGAMPPTVGVEELPQGGSGRRQRRNGRGAAAKRQLSDDDSEDENGDEETGHQHRRRMEADDSTSVPAALPGSKSAGGGSASATNAPVAKALNLPHPAVAPSLNTGCVATVLADSAPELRPHQVVELLGFVVERDDVTGTIHPDGTTENAPRDPTGIQFGGEEDIDDALSGMCRFEMLPPTQVAFLTCIAVRPLPTVADINRSLYGPLRRPPPTSDEGSSAAWFDERRTRAHEYLTSAVCGGDMLAADYLLVALCSRVLHRTGEVPIGDVPLMIHHNDFTKPVVDSWAAALRAILPAGCVSHDLSRVDPPLVPKKDFAQNCIVAAGTQLPVGSTSLLYVPSNPSAVVPKDDDLINLLHRQVVAVDFVYHKTALNTDVTNVLLSACPPDAAPLALKVCCSLILDGDPSAPAEFPPAATSERCGNAVNPQLEALREYFVAVKSVTPNGANEDDTTRQRMAKDLEETMQQSPDQFNRDPVLHNNSANVRMALVRAFAASVGSSTIAWEHYEAAKNMESRRFERNSNFVSI